MFPSSTHQMSLTNDQISTDEQQQQQQQQQHISKVKKRHGNRRLQRFRRKCRKQGMNLDTIQSFIVHQQANKSFHYDLDSDNTNSSRTQVKSEFQDIQNITSDAVCSSFHAHRFIRRNMQIKKKHWQLPKNNLQISFYHVQKSFVGATYQLIIGNKF